jgi:ABC-type transport system involved in Fe-S cluster assembly fused permease/ATPase subunit
VLQRIDDSNDEVQPEPGTLPTLRRLWPYMWPPGRVDLKARVVIALFLLVMAKVITVLVPYTYKWAVDSLTDPASFAQGVPPWLVFAAVPVALVVAYALGRVLAMGFQQLRDAVFANVAQHAVRGLANRTFQHLHALSLRFHLERRTGGLNRVIERGVKGVEIIIRWALLSTVPTILEFILVAVVIWLQFSVSYLGVLLTMMVIYLWFTVKITEWRMGIRREMNDSDTEANAKAVDSLLNFETVKYFNNETMESRRFDRSMAGYESAAIKTQTSLAWMNIGQSVIFTIGMMVCMLMAAQEVTEGTMSIGGFVMINAMLIQLYMPLNFIGTVYREIKQGLIDLEAMFKVLDQAPEVVDRPGAGAIDIGEGAIRFQDVEFSYEANRKILKGISFHVPAGRTVAVVGPSGAGKSTLSRILFRFYDIQSGSVTIDGQDVREVNQTSLRRQIGIVPQDTVLFNDTIAYNIRYGRIDASDEEVREAARMAQIDGFIESLPEGFDTMVGERGLKLSGGEKQRVAIARTILKAPPILVLDEATSALDTHTEKEIQSALNTVSEGRTTIVIAHRLSTVVSADEILVLVKGEIVERGGHDSLMAQEGVYASMWNRQREADEAAERLRSTVEADAEGYLDIGRTRGDPVER